MAGTVPSAAVGAVLAGGLGRRMGGSKALAELDSRPLLAHPVAALRSAVAQVAVIARADVELPPLPPDVSVWLEAEGPRHPLLGVREALRRAAGRPVVALAGDMPLVTAAFLRTLARAPANGRAVVVPRAGGRLQPLCARYEPAALSALEAMDADARVTHVVAALGPEVLEVADATQFFNVNRPEDLPVAAALLARRR